MIYNMTTAFITHPIFQLHEPNPGHPECPERLQAIEAALCGADFSALRRYEAIAALEADLLLAHSPEHIAFVKGYRPIMGMNFLDGDTYMSVKSWDAALHAAGAVLQGVDLVLSGATHNAFCAVRPPGHHAHHQQAGGFCLLNNIAIGAIAALQRHDLKRIAIIDFDVHHGDGTQNIMWNRDDVLFASLHQSPLYPMTGSIHERGAHDNIINVPLPVGAQGDALSESLRELIIPSLYDFKPEMIFVSAGFDGHRDDPLGGWALTEQDYAALMDMILTAARDLCGGRVVTVLEGGYHLDALGASVAATLKTLLTKAD